MPSIAIPMSASNKDRADLKIDRAAKHISDLKMLFQERRPFTYVLETDTNARQRATFAKQNETAINDAALICGDAAQNIRSSLDHAYWRIIAPYTRSERERGNVQFPFCKLAADLEKAVKNRLSDRVSEAFTQALIDLAPHGESGGNKLLYLIHTLGIVDRHKLLIPTADYTRVTGAMLWPQIPDLPRSMQSASVTFGGSFRDMIWSYSSPNPAFLENAKDVGSGKFEEELKVHVDIVLAVAPPAPFYPLIPTLYQILDVAKTVIAVLRRF